MSVQYAKEYTLGDLLVVTTSREIHDYDVLMAGVGIPTLAASLASMSHAPHIVVTTEWGTVNPNARRLLYSVTDTTVNERAVAFPSSFVLMNDMQRGRLDLGVIGGAQVDKYGNVNSTWIADKETGKLKVMLPGSGGANDIATSAGRTVIMMRSTAKSFVQKVDYITSPGFIDGPGARERYGMPGGGPEIVISAEGTFRFDKDTKEMYLDTYHPGLSVDKIKEMVPWDLKVSPDVRETAPPTVDEIEILQVLDPTGFYVGTGKQGLKDNPAFAFDQFLKGMEESYGIMGRFIRRAD